ncbi:unnamed protein product [Rotaria socialis]|uniref:Uncharacterized protein n=1 Tax=Rotaria socialis TaxID=392032 RepID=A0A821B2Z5_9BILA|nr:unnamed protein product [Rotaria socialis]
MLIIRSRCTQVSIKANNNTVYIDPVLLSKNDCISTSPLAAILFLVVLLAVIICIGYCCCCCCRRRRQTIPAQRGDQYRLHRHRRLLAISPSSSLTGFNPLGVITGHTELSTAAQEQTDATLAYNQLMSTPYIVDMIGIDLAGKTLGSGVYKLSPTTMNLIGILTFNGKGICILQVGTSIITGANFQVLAINEATAGCVFWQVGNSFTFDASSQFLGNIFA